MKKTPEQQAFVDRILDRNATDSIILKAVAGSGKTTTILSPMSNTDDLNGRSVAIIAYNKAIAAEIQDKLKKMEVPANIAQAGTCHSYGLKAFKKANANFQVNGSKVYFIVEDYFKANAELPWIMKAMIRKLVSLGKQNGAGIAFDFQDNKSWDDMVVHYDVNDTDVIDNEELIKHTVKVLRLSNQNLKMIDFDDMIYLPLLQKLRFDQFDIVMIDEAQDINWSRRELASRMLKPKGRLVAVGDENQAIYGFTGAGADSLNEIQKQFNATPMPLSFCFRSGRKIVEFAQRWNPVIQPAPNAIEGEVSNMTMDDFWNNDLGKDHVMLCRNTKPLVQTAFGLIRKGVPCYVEGKDIGEGLKKLALKWKVKNIGAFQDKLDGWKDREIVKARAIEDENKEQNIVDIYDTMMVFVQKCLAAKRTLVTDIVAEIDLLFRDTEEGKRPDCFTLSTIHKSKGREWEVVYWLDRLGTLPSKYAKKPWQIKQEMNLCYVAATRAKEKLIEVR